MPAQMASNTQQKNPQTNLTRNEEALLSPTEKVIASRNIMAKKSALQKIEHMKSFAELCRKQTLNKYKEINKRIERLSSIGR